MSTDIQLGEVEQLPLQRHRRPDRNRHFAVRAYGQPRSGQLPIFVDVDVMRDMEAHARTNTEVELGGVMLGGQYVDEDGEKFVLVTDALRAQHYEATRGSFKFTHDTWSEITRQRDEFPEEIQMVGWYHTHPNWGVFLSEMDRFICDHFFNKPLDVALVIDPCRGDRGFFEWRRDAEDALPRTGGYYVTASRFRQRELAYFVSNLERSSAMNTDTFEPLAAPHPAPVIHNHMAGGNSAWLPLAVVGMLAAQLLLTTLLAYRAVVPAAMPQAAVSQEDQIQTLVERIDKQGDYKLATVKETLDEVFRHLDVQTDGLSGQLQSERGENENLRAAVVGYRALEDRVARLDDQLQKNLTSHEHLTKKMEESQERNKLLRDANREARARADELKERLEELTTQNERHEKNATELSRLDPKVYRRWQQAVTAEEIAVDKSQSEPDSSWTWGWTAMIGTAVVVAAALVSGVVFIRRRAYFEEQT